MAGKVAVVEEAKRMVVEQIKKQEDGRKSGQ